MEDKHSPLFLSQGLRALAKSHKDARLKSSCHMGNVNQSFSNPVASWLGTRRRLCENGAAFQKRKRQVVGLTPGTRVRPE